jgi:hypothetical protein
MIEPADLKQIEDMIKRALSSRQPSINTGNDTVKARHIGEGVRFVRCGLAAARPTAGERAGAIYFATDTFVLSVYTGSAWKDETLS